MVPTEGRQPLPARERWFWAGVGGVSALAILLLGLALAATIAARSAQKRTIAHRPASPSPARLKPGPSPPVAHPQKSNPRIARKKVLRPIVRVVERPVRPEERAPSSSTAKPSGLAAPAAASAHVGQRPSAPGVQAVPASTADRVAASREEWKPVSPRQAQTSGAGASDGSSPGRASEVTPPRLVRSRGADYPTSAMEDGVTGKVRLELAVGPDGSVDRAEVTQSSGDARLDAAAARAALTWRYQPTRRNGRSVPSVDHVQFDFFRRGD